MGEGDQNTDIKVCVSLPALRGRGQGWGATTTGG
jgi:hypothetical protein